VCDKNGKYPVTATVEQFSEPPSSAIVRHDQLEVFQLAFQAATTVFELSKVFPSEERYSLTDQIRKSSRSVCANIAEGWRKRRYKAAFQSSLNISEAEAAETQTWLRFADECGYANKDEVDSLIVTYDLVIGKLVVIINNPEPWLLKGASNSS